MLSVYYHNRASGEVLANPGTKSGRAFYYMTEAVRAYISESEAIVLAGYRPPFTTGIVYGVQPDELWIDPRDFCLLVEMLYLDPCPEFYDWALHAAILVEEISEKRFTWEWRLDRLPDNARPMGTTFGDFERPISVEPGVWPETRRPLEHSGITIGPYNPGE